MIGPRGAAEAPAEGKKAPPCASARAVFLRRKKPDALLVVDLVTDEVPDRFGSAGYVQHMAGRVSVDLDASHSRTTLKWYDVAEPGAVRRSAEPWPTRHRTTGSYYPILISHPMVDGPPLRPRPARHRLLRPPPAGRALIGDRQRRRQPADRHRYQRR